MLRARVLFLFLAVLCAAAVPARGASTYFNGVETLDGIAYFTTDNTMCRTDGTAAGTRCFPVAAPLRFAPALLNGKLYSVAGWKNSVLYAFDGQSAPVQVMKFGAGDSVSYLASNGAQLFFLAQHEIPDGIRLMRTDGTEPGTSLVRILPADWARLSPGMGDFVLLQLRSTEQYEWWASDGTYDRTIRLLPPNAFPVLPPLGRVLLFYDNGRNQIWRSDGTAAGMFPLVDGGPPPRITVREDVAYFTLRRQVWRTDGTTATPLRKVDFDPGITGAAGSRLCFVEKQQDAVVVWGAPDTYGIPAVLARIPAPQGASTVEMPATMGHAGPLVFFALGIGKGMELWRSDGTAAGTFRVATFPITLNYGKWFKALGRKVFFFADDGIHGAEPWISDGTREGTFMLANLTPEGTIRGTVTDAATGLPLAGAIVELTGSFPAKSARTDAEGRYTLEGALGTETVQARTEAHLPSQRDVTVAAYEAVTLDFALGLGGRIAGRVVDPDGKPLGAMRGKLLGGDGTKSPILTDAQGRFASGPLSTVVGWAVQMDTQGFYNQSIQPDVQLAAGETREIGITMQPFGVVRVRLIDAATGELIHTRHSGYVVISDRIWGQEYERFFADAPVVEIRRPDGIHQLHSHTESYRDAWFGGAECRDGNAQLCSLTPQGDRGSVSFSGGTTQTIDLVLRPKGASIRGVFLDAETGARLTGVLLVASNTTGPGGDWALTSDGSFETEPVLPDGRYRLRTSDNSGSPYVPADLETDVRFAQSPRTEVEIRLTRGGTLHGRVTDGKGRSLPDVRVEVAPDHATTTDWRGSYSIRALPTGTYTIIAKRTGYGDARATGIAVTAGRKTKLDLTMKVSPGGAP